MSTNPSGGPSPAPTQPVPGHGPAPESAFFASLRRSGLWRTQDRWIGGVAAGVARRLGVDPLLVRGVLVVLTLFGGLGLLLYGVGWALLPEETDGRIHLQEALRGNVDAALAGSVVFVILGLARPGFWWAGWYGWNDAGFWSAVSLATVALVILGIYALAKRREPGTLPPPTSPQPSGTRWQPGAAAWQPGATASDPGPTPWQPGPPASEPGRTPGQGGATAWRPGTTAWESAAAWQPGHRPAPPNPAPGPAPSGSAAAGQTGDPTSEVSMSATPTATPPRGAGQPGSSPGWAPAPGPSYPPPPRPRVPGPGSTLVAVALAVALLATAGVLMWERAYAPDWSLPLVIGGTVLTVLGLAALVAGFIGRHGGALSVLGVVLALLVVPGAAVATALPGNLGLTGGARIGDVSVVPTTVERAERGYDLAAGDLEVDLTQLPLDADRPVRVPIDVGAGNIRVLLPADVAAEVRVELGAGEVRTLAQPGWASEDSGPAQLEGTTSRQRTTWVSGVAIDTALTSPAARADGADLVVVVNAGASDVLIEEAR